MDRLFSAPDSVTQSILIALCDDDRIQARALKYLGELEDYATRRTAATHNDNNNNNNNDDRDLRGGNAGGGGSGAGGLGGGGSNSANPLKRQQRATEPAQICLQCKHAFTPSSNAAEACLYHHGELDVDEEHATWIDWDEAVAGPNDSPENREDYPEAFQWGEFFYLSIFFEISCLWTIKVLSLPYPTYPRVPIKVSLPSYCRLAS